MCQLDPDWWEYVGDFNVTEASKYSHALKDLINLILEEPTLGGLNNKAIIPTKLSIEMDGIGGLIIGNLFKIPEDLVPKGYKGSEVGAKVGYTITSLGHSVSNNDWVTKIGESEISSSSDSVVVVSSSASPSSQLSERSKRASIARVASSPSSFLPR